MTRENIMEAMNGIGEHLIVEAAEKLGFLNGSVAIAKAERRKGQGPLSRFINSGWGVAAVCALVAVSVMGGIIWAGQQPAGGPGGSLPFETEYITENESANEDYTGDDQTEMSSNETIDVNTPVFEYLDSLVAIDQLAQNFSIKLKYYATPYNGLLQEFNGSVGQVGGKHWAYTNYDGAAVLEEEGGYYHAYVYEGSKFWYRDTYTMTDNNEFERVYEGRYWWSNYLEELTFDAYDALVYKGTALVSERLCNIFSFNGEVNDGSLVYLSLYVATSDNNVMKMEVEIIRSSQNSHLSTDIREITIEVERILMGNDAKGPTLPDPKWDGPQDDGPIEIETPPATESTEEPETGKTEPPTVIPDLDDLMAAPLVSATDSESYVRIPYLSRGMGGMMEFFILPEGAQDASELVSVYKIGFPEDHETNLLVVGVEKSANRYCVLFFMETSYVTELDGEEIRYVGMTCTEMVFVRDNSLSATGNTYFLMQNGGAASFQYTDQQRSSILASKRRENLNALTKAEALIESYRNATDNKYTVIYSYSDQSAEEMAMAYIPELPEISFEIFREYGFDD